MPELSTNSQLTLEVTVMSAFDLHEVIHTSNAGVCALVWISDDPEGKQKTPVESDGGKDRYFNHTMEFTIDESAAKKNDPKLTFQLRWDEISMGKAHERVICLLKDVNKPVQYRYYEVKKNAFDERVMGILNISYCVSDKISSPASMPDMPNAYIATEVGSSSAHPPNRVTMHHVPPENFPYPPPNGYPPPQSVAGYGYPPQQPPPHGLYPPYMYSPPCPYPYGWATMPPPRPGYGYHPQHVIPPPQESGYRPMQNDNQVANLMKKVGTAVRVSLLASLLKDDEPGAGSDDAGFDDAGVF